MQDKAPAFQAPESRGLEVCLLLALILTRRIADTEAMLEVDPLPCRHLLLEPPNVQEGLLKL